MDHGAGRLRWLGWPLPSDSRRVIGEGHGDPHAHGNDTWGAAEVPADRHWRPDPALAEHFDIGASVAMIRALGLVKKACAVVNRDWDSPGAGAGQSVLRPTRSSRARSTSTSLVIWQTGSGTQTNMNANEVIANRAIERSAGGWAPSVRCTPTTT